MQSELKRAIEAAKSRVELQPKGFGHREETVFLATHGDALIAAIELAEADYEHQLLCRTTNSGDFVAATRRLNVAREANYRSRLDTAKEGAKP